MREIGPDRALIRPQRGQVQDAFFLFLPSTPQQRPTSKFDGPRAKKRGGKPLSFRRRAAALSSPRRRGRPGTIPEHASEARRSAKRAPKEQRQGGERAWRRLAKEEAIELSGLSLIFLLPSNSLARPLSPPANASSAARNSPPSPREALAHVLNTETRRKLTCCFAFGLQPGSPER
jgi:hypothetical protein